jgi:hypothetical protein
MTTDDKQARRLISSASGDGTMVECIQDEDGTTRFAICADREVRLDDHWEDGGIRYVPIKSTHNLLKHKAIKLSGPPIAYGSPAELLAEIEAYASRYVSLSDTFAKVAAAYVLLTWVHDAFNELPYLRFRGDYGSGKTRALIVFGSICYKGFFASGASTVSPIFHTLDAFKGTLIFDEADFRFTDEKAELVKILNNGNVKGFSVLRTQVTASKEFEPRAFSVFGPKIVGMRGAYDDKALESRFLTAEMSGQRLGAEIPISLPAEQEREARELRSKLLMYRFCARNQTAVDPSLADPFLEPRMNQVLLPLLSVAPSPEVQHAIRGYADQVQETALSDRLNSTEGQLLSVIAAALASGATGSLSLKTIVTAFTEHFGGEYDRPITHRFLGNVLRNRLGLPLYKTAGVVAVSLKDMARIEALLSRYGISEGVWKKSG